MRFLIHFAQTHGKFRLPELESLSIIENVPFTYEPGTYSEETPFFVVDVKDVESAKRLVRRSILVKDIIELWAEGTDLQDLISTHRPTIEQRQEPYMTKTFRFLVETYGNSLEMSEQVAIVNQFSFMALRGKVNLKKAEVSFSVCLDYGNAKKLAAGKKECEEGDQVDAKSEVKQSKSLRCYMGVRIAEGARSVVNFFDLKKRSYLGTTSMDAELSLVMANQALVKPGSIVLDPFVGTGSFLVTCAYFGGFAYGSDIDGRQIRGRDAFISGNQKPPTKRKTFGTNPKGNVYSNIEQYGVQNRVLDCFVGDLAHHPWRDRTPIFDAIVTDPPYGVRAGAKKIGIPESLPTDIQRDMIRDNGSMKYPLTKPWEMSEVIENLLEFAAQYLVKGGRLVYWLPLSSEYYHVDKLPTHPSLTIISQSEQEFGKWSRILVTMSKTQDYIPQSKKESESQESLDKKEVIVEKPHAHFRDQYFSKFDAGK